MGSPISLRSPMKRKSEQTSGPSAKKQKRIEAKKVDEIIRNVEAAGDTITDSKAKLSMKEQHIDELPKRNENPEYEAEQDKEGIKYMSKEHSSLDEHSNNQIKELQLALEEQEQDNYELTHRAETAEQDAKGLRAQKEIDDQQIIELDNELIALKDQLRDSKATSKAELKKLEEEKSNLEHENLMLKQQIQTTNQWEEYFAEIQARL
ncbi:hypothetical protein BDV96DRAFT_647360 [Lophiotrema nucula]|uniref:Uncharacterized protein n=1 Tax=Lophiotrema nucula TaxID=690887 RepID=A0A6A5Z796_9PLEO|nr:hypothetical protein BDV96DRAFT_647360 [Lophiotrema nucula]